MPGVICLVYSSNAALNLFHQCSHDNGWGGAPNVV